MALNMQWTKEDFDKLTTNLQNMRDYEKNSIDNSQYFESCAHLRCTSCKGQGLSQTVKCVFMHFHVLVRVVGLIARRVYGQTNC